MTTTNAYDWGHNGKVHPDDDIDFELDLGCGRAKKGRIGVDRFPDEGVDVVFDFDRMCQYHPTTNWTRAGDDWAYVGKMPFADESIGSIISHHALEHVGDGFIRLMDECWRILAPGGLFRIIVPVFPSWDAIADPDHKRVFVPGSFDFFCGSGELAVPLDAYSTPYTVCRFVKENEQVSPPTPPSLAFTPKDRREMRVSLRKPE